MTSTVVFASGELRRRCDVHARKPYAAAACVTLVAALLTGTGGDARANESTLLPKLVCAPEATSPGPFDMMKCPVSQRFTGSFNFHYNSPVLNLRASSLLLDDITGELPRLQFDLPPPKPVQLAALTPPAAVDALVEEEYPLAPTVFSGIASTYNPHDPTDKFAGGMETASGETYEINGWTAAIRTDLRKQFGGVRYGRNYKLTFALVELGAKRIIVKVNDVGPLRPGRIIDLNKRAMQYFDPSLKLGLLHGVQVTPLDGTDWKPGPVGDDAEIITVAGDFDR
jgi:rare lipoprotein A